MGVTGGHLGSELFLVNIAQQHLDTTLALQHLDTRHLSKYIVGVVAMLIGNTQNYSNSGTNL